MMAVAGVIISDLVEKTGTQTKIYSTEGLDATA